MVLNKAKQKKNRFFLLSFVFWVLQSIKLGQGTWLSEYSGTKGYDSIKTIIKIMMPEHFSEMGIYFVFI